MPGTFKKTREFEFDVGDSTLAFQDAADDRGILVTVYAAHGSTKGKLLNANLYPTIEAAAADALREWACASRTPDDLQDLAHGIASLLDWWRDEE